MSTFIVERHMPGAADLTPEQAQAFTRRSLCVIEQMPGVRWDRSYVTQDAVFCIYEAPDARTVAEHARRTEIPADVVTEVRAVVDPAQASG